MWKCRKCGKPVYFAERRQSIGYDWHPWCLKCQECGKRLHPGSHAEHKSNPYCNIPCYSALFGPKLFGHGSTTESHQSFGKRTPSFIKEEKELERTINDYNAKIDKNLRISSREVNYRLVMEGVLRVYWGVSSSIRLKEFDDKRIIRKNSSLSSDEFAVLESSSDDSEFEEENSKFQVVNKNLRNGTSKSGGESTIFEDDEKTSKTLPAKFFDENKNGEGEKNPPSFFRLEDKSQSIGNLENQNGVMNSNAKQSTLSSLMERSLEVENLNELLNEKMKVEEMIVQDTNANELKAVIKEGTKTLLRRRPGRRMDRTKLMRRKSSINGHWYNRDTSVFTPPKDSMMSVHVTSLLTAADVIKMILEKYKIESPKEEFALYVSKDSGEKRKVNSFEAPLRLRVNLGPDESAARIYLLKVKTAEEIDHEVAQYLKFSYVEIRNILNMIYEQEEKEIEAVKRKYRETKSWINERLFHLKKYQSPQKT